MYKIPIEREIRLRRPVFSRTFNPAGTALLRFALFNSTEATMPYGEIFADPVFPIGAGLALLLAFAYMWLPV